MSNSTQFNGGYRTVSQVFGGNTVHPVSGAWGIYNARLGTPASWVSGNFQTLLSVSGRGTINFAALRALNATARTLRLRISIDGRVSPYLSDLSLSVAGTGHAVVGLGGFSYSTEGTYAWLTAEFQPIPFSSSLLVEASNSLTEAGSNTEFIYNYEVNL